MERKEMDKNFPNRTVYHYCSQESFVNIIKTKEMWLSNAENTNDKLELEYVNYEVRKIADEVVQQDMSLKQKCEELKRIYGKSDWYDKPYIGCFSGNANNLSQWRLYADNAQGMAIGFSSSLLEGKLNCDFSRGILQEGYAAYKVKYADEEYENNIRKMVESKLKGNGDYKLDIEDIIYGRANFFVKSKVFQYEEEYRILYYPKLADVSGEGREYRRTADFYLNKQVDFRVVNGKLVSFWKMPIDGGITEVVLGPKCETKKENVRGFLQKNDFQDVEIEKSDISYR